MDDTLFVGAHQHTTRSWRRYSSPSKSTACSISVPDVSLKALTSGMSSEADTYVHRKDGQFQPTIRPISRAHSPPALTICSADLTFYSFDFPCAVSILRQGIYLVCFNDGAILRAALRRHVTPYGSQCPSMGSRPQQTLTGPIKASTQLRV